MRCLLKEKAREKGFLIASHRGVWGANVIQNTLLAFRTALDQGADILETDVVPCADGSLWCFHDGSEDRVFGRPFDIMRLTPEEILSLRPLNAYQQKTSAQVPRFEEVLELALENGAFLNVDRAWDWMDRVTGVLDRAPGASEYCLLKAPVAKGRECMEFLAAHPVKYPFIAICYSEKDVEDALAVPGLRLVAAEMIAFDENSGMFGAGAVKRVHERGLLAWVNAIRLGDGPRDRLYAGVDDEASLAVSPREGWVRLKEMGFDIIQTDWPAQARKSLST